MSAENAGRSQKVSKIGVPVTLCIVEVIDGAENGGVN